MLQPFRTRSMLAITLPDYTVQSHRSVGKRFARDILKPLDQVSEIDLDTLHAEARDWAPIRHLGLT